MADNKIQKPEAPEVVAQEAKLVGDDEIREANEFEVAPEVNVEAVPAQVAQPREDPSDQVPVHETHVKLDEVITDPSDPRAVQVPDEGRGNAGLPIHRLGEPSPEEVFAEEASEAKEVSDDDRRRASVEGSSIAPQPPAQASKSGKDK